MSTMRKDFFLGGEHPLPPLIYPESSLPRVEEFGERPDQALAVELNSHAGSKLRPHLALKVVEQGLEERLRHTAVLETGELASVVAAVHVESCARLDWKRSPRLLAEKLDAFLALLVNDALCSSLGRVARVMHEGLQSNKPRLVALGDRAELVRVLPQVINNITYLFDHESTSLKLRLDVLAYALGGAIDEHIGDPLGNRTANGWGIKFLSNFGSF